MIAFVEIALFYDYQINTIVNLILGEASAVFIRFSTGFIRRVILLERSLFLRYLADFADFFSSFQVAPRADSPS
jgi:hypothetical protein